MSKLSYRDSVEPGAECDIKVGDLATFFYDGVECAGVVTKPAAHGLVCVSLRKSGRLKLPKNTPLCTSTLQIANVRRGKRVVFWRAP
jgi:hypothetical protein